MLKVIKQLSPFFEDCYRRIHVREYAKISKISPPTSSKLLENMYKIKLLKKEKEKQYIYYYANKESELFVELSRIYWRLKLKKSGLLDFFEKELLFPIIILFGSLSKAEAKADSDIDLAIFTASQKKLNIEEYEKKLKRKIQILIFKKIEDIKNKELRKNILNGYKLMGAF